MKILSITLYSIMVLSTTLSTLAYGTTLSYPYHAMIKVPIADLLGEPISKAGLHNNQTKAYQEIPISWGPNDTDRAVCPRIHQALLHQIVTVHEKQGAEVRITLDSAYYISKQTNSLSNSYWTLEANVIPLKELQKAGISDDYFPPSLHETYTSNTVALIYPFYDRVSQIGYSAGTRFVYSGQTANTYNVFAFDGSNNELHFSELPKNICHFVRSSTTSQQKQNNFVTLLHNWSTNIHGFIPLVWGGCSFQRFYKKDDAHLGTKTMLDGKQLAYWYRIGYTQTPFSGFDASNLILLAAQIVGIPYFYKNSATALAHLNKVTSYSQLREGDLLWLSPGIAVVASLERNTLITVFSYTLGYGKVVELPLSRVFEGINSWHQLFDSQNSLTLLDAHGQTARPVKNWELLSLQSVFNKSGNF